MNDLVFLSLKRMAAMVRNKTVSSAELMKAHLDHIASVNPRLNAIVELAADAAMASATALRPPFRRADSCLLRKDSPCAAGARGSPLMRPGVTWRFVRRWMTYGDTRGNWAHAPHQGDSAARLRRSFSPASSIRCCKVGPSKLPSSSRMWGQMRMTVSRLTFSFCVERNSTPSRGRSPSRGIFLVFA